MPLMLVSVSHDTNNIINGTILFIRSRWSKGDVTRLFLVMWYHWHQHQHHVMPMALSIVPLHGFSQDNQNEVQHWNWCWQHMVSMPSEMVPLHSLGQDNWDQMEHNFFGHLMLLALTSVSHHVMRFINGTTAFLRFRQLKWGHIMPLTTILALHGASDIAVGLLWYHCIGVSSMWCRQQHQ